jgi:predicted anti-sigma-YlaC factor YlaD
MRCEHVRQALSARLDGEAPGLADAAVEGHLARCPACRAWEAAAADATRIVRVAPADRVPDLSAGILAAAPELRPPLLARWLASPWRVGLVGVALVQVAVVVSALASGDAGATAHVTHELYAIDLALAAGFLAAAARPARAWGMLPLVAAVVTCLLVTAGVDLLDGDVAATGEVNHLLEVMGLGFLWQLARRRPASAARGTVGLA